MLKNLTKKAQQSKLIIVKYPLNSDYY